jgi:hypothetical protein
MLECLEPFRTRGLARSDQLSHGHRLVDVDQRSLCVTEPAISLFPDAVGARGGGTDGQRSLLLPAIAVRN